jgi:hypothetical protein
LALDLEKGGTDRMALQEEDRRLVEPFLLPFANCRLAYPNRAKILRHHSPAEIGQCDPTTYVVFHVSEFRVRRCHSNVLTYFVFDVLLLVEMSQSNFCRILIAFLKVLARKGNVQSRHVPPIGKPLAIIQPWKFALSIAIDAINFSVGQDGNVKLQRISFDSKLIFKIVESAGITMHGKEVPIGTVLFSGMVNYRPVS